MGKDKAYKHGHIAQHHAGDYDYCVKCGAIFPKSGPARLTPCKVPSLDGHRKYEVKK